jgi:predicted metal-binding protein
MKWDEAALQELEKVPDFVREMAKQKVESVVKDKGKSSVSLKDVQEVFEEYMSFMESADKNSKSATHIALIRCDRISEVCPATACLLALHEKKVHFKEYGDDTKLVAFFTCGGCPGRRISRLLNTLVKTIKVDVVHLSSCMVKDDYQPPCPHRVSIIAMIQKKGIKVVEGSHH